MRIVLDTNVIISAFAGRGLCSEIFEVCLEDHDIITSEHILAEVKENLVEKIHLPQSVVKKIIDYLRDTTEVFEPESLNGQVCRDKADDKIIGTALKGNAGFIITGDNGLLTLKKYSEIKIITPREFWNFLKQGMG